MNITVLCFLAYSAAVLGVGFWAARKPQVTADEIHLGNREHGSWTSALSAAASTESGFVLLGMVGMGYSVGANAFWIVPAGILGYLLNWLVLGPKLRQKSAEYGAVTMPEVIAASTGGGRVSRWAAGLASILALFFLSAYVAAQFNAAGKALATQFGISFWLAVLLGSGVVVIYSAMGGFRAVSWTDNIQAAMMVVALIILPAVVIFRAGGLETVLDRLAAVDPKLLSFSAGAHGWAAVLSALPWLMLGLAYPGQPHAVARLMATRNRATLGPAAAISTIWFVLVYSGAVTLGMAARAGFAAIPAIATDPETTLPVLAVQVLPGILAGIVLAAILAAISSTADSTLLSAGTTVVRDLPAAIRHRHLKRELPWLRLILLLVAAIAVYFALDEEGLVFTLVLYAWSGLGASLGPTMLYCALARRPKPISALSGLIVGGAAALALHSYSLNLLAGFALSSVAILGTHLVAHLWSQSRSRNSLELDAE